jgi:two-component system sensor histidine kinase ChvG
VSSSSESGRSSGLWEKLCKATAPLWIRLLAFNLLLVFLPVVGIAYLDVYESQLLAGQEREMVQQGRVLAASLGVGGGDLGAEAEGLLLRLGQRNTARLRVIDLAGNVIADSSRSGPREEIQDGEVESDESLRGRPLYRLGSWLFRLYELFVPPNGVGFEIEPADHPAGGRATSAALEGRYGATTRISPGQRSVTLYSAIPIRSDERVTGAVLVSQSTLRILQDLYEVRLAVFRVVLASVVVAVVLSLLVSTTIVRPLHRLRREAVRIVDRKGRLRGSFGGSERRDEIGDLSRALESLSHHLQEHLGFIESFAADVSHEFRNPLASVRGAVEVLGDTEDESEKKQLIEIGLREIARLERLLETVREITVIDARLESEEQIRIVPNDLIESLLTAQWIEDSTARVQLRVEDGARGATVLMAPDRFVQIVRNLLDNALSFAPKDSSVEISLGLDLDSLKISVRDHGPGFPPENGERLFDRFFSYRKDLVKGEHAGLGLAIVKAIVEGYAGSVEGRNADGGGAIFTISLPLSGD